jgi:hypothetical protein
MTVRRLGHPRRHYWLVKRMAGAAEVDLVRAREEGVLSAQVWAGMVQRCRGCGDAARCAAWLDTAPCVSTPPARCRNRARLTALKIEQDVVG